LKIKLTFIQVINFLTNAIKFSRDADKRQITIRLAASLTKPTKEDFGISFLAPRKDPYRDSSLPPTPSVSSSVQTWTNGEELYLFISVEDTGVGLTEEECKILFARFAQGMLPLLLIRSDI
jgi:signal transduction histidine kinase